MKSHSVMEDIGAEIGYTATTALVTWFGGAPVYVPLTADEDHAMGKIIGMPAFRRLVAAFGGESFHVPESTATKATQRARRVARLLLAGRSEREIAAEEGVTERRVYQLRRQLQADGILEAISQNC
ncbi:MAG TPA: hypothetical protein VGE10_05355 [Zeimonas sp.]